MVTSPCSTIDTRRVNIVTNLVISHERGKDREVFTTSGAYPWSFVTQIRKSKRTTKNVQSGDTAYIGTRHGATTKKTEKKGTTRT